MDRKGAQDIHDILLSVPGLSYSSTEPGQSRYSIRGVSTAASNPTVGIYLDDISLVSLTTAFSGAADPVLFDLDRVEVLKGPQGTLYGGSAMGGAIKYVNRQPSFNQLSVTAEGGVATTDQGGISYNGNSVLNLPLVSDKLAMRLGVSYRHDAGYINYVPDAPLQDWARGAAPSGEPFAPETNSSLSNLYRSDANSRSTTAVRLALKYAVDDSFSILPAASIQRSDKANPDWFYTNLPGLQASFRTNQPTRDDLGVYSLTVTKSFAGLALTSLSGYVVRTVEWDRDYSLFIGGLVPGLFPDNSYNVSNTSAHTLSLEVRLFMRRRRAAQVGDRRILFATALRAVPARGHRRCRSLPRHGYGHHLRGRPAHPHLSGRSVRGRHVFPERAMGPQCRAALVRHPTKDRWRFQRVLQRWRKCDRWEPQHRCRRHSEILGELPAARRSTPVRDSQQGVSRGQPEPVQHRQSPVQPDFQGSGSVARPPAANPTVWTYELGSKNEFKELHTVVDAAVYYTDWKKIQQEVNLNSCGFNFVGNLGAATIKGAELSAESALGGGVSAGVTGSYLDTRITQSAPGVSAQVGQPTSIRFKWMVSACSGTNFLSSPVGRAACVPNISSM